MTMWTLFRALPLAWQAGIAAGAFAALIGGYGLWHHKVYRAGYDKAIADVAAQDRRAIDAADRARDRVRQCADSGGVWVVESGECRRR